MSDETQWDLEGTQAYVRGKVLSGMRGYDRPFSEILVAVLEEGLAIYDLSDEIDEHHNWNYRMGEWCGKTGVHRAHDYERKHTCPGVTLESKDDGTFRLGKTPKPCPTSESGVGDSPPAMLGDERREEPVNASSSSPILVPMDAERIAALREMLDDQVESSANSALCGGTVPEKWLRHERVLRAILRDAGADD